MLDKPGGHNPYHTLVPFRIKKYRRLPASQFLIGL
jgi:hypothetical protein